MAGAPRRMTKSHKNNGNPFFKIIKKGGKKKQGKALKMHVGKPRGG